MREKPKGQTEISIHKDDGTDRPVLHSLGETPLGTVHSPSSIPAGESLTCARYDLFTPMPNKRQLIRPPLPCLNHSHHPDDDREQDVQEQEESETGFKILLPARGSCLGGAQQDKAHKQCHGEDL